MGESGEGEQQGREGGREGIRVPNPSLLWRRQTSGFDYSNRCKPMQLEKECQRKQGIHSGTIISTLIGSKCEES